MDCFHICCFRISNFMGSVYLSLVQLGDCGVRQQSSLFCKCYPSIGITRVTCDNETSLGNFPVTLRSCIPRDTGECATLVPYRTRLFAYLMPPGVFLRLKMDDESTVTSGAPSFSSFYYTQLCQANLIYGRCLLFLIYLI